MIRDAQALLLRVDFAFMGPEFTNFSANIFACARSLVELRGPPPFDGPSWQQDAVGNVAMERLSMDGLILAVAEVGVVGDRARRLLTRRVAGGSEWRRGIDSAGFEARVVEAEGDTVRAYRLP